MSYADEDEVEFVEHAFAVDVGIFMELNDPPGGSTRVDYGQLEFAVRLIEFLKANDGVVLFDSEGTIESEYRNVLKRDTLGWVLWQELLPFQSLYTSRPTATVGSQLEKIGFDPSDRKYVAVASRGRGTYLTHETKHLRPEIREHVVSTCGVDIFSRNDASKYMSHVEGVL